MITDGSPPIVGPLKNVTGEPATIGACSGKLTTALPKPVPTIAPVHSLRAASGVVAVSSASLHRGKPRVSKCPNLSNSTVTSVTGGGDEPSLVRMLLWPQNLIGSSCTPESVLGAEPKPKSMTRFPATIRVALAVPRQISTTRPTARIANLSSVLAGMIDLPVCCATYSAQFCHDCASRTDEPAEGTNFKLSLLT